MWPNKKDMHALLWNNSDLMFNKYAYSSIFFLKGTLLKGISKQILHGFWTNTIS